MGDTTINTGTANSSAVLGVDANTNVTGVAGGEGSGATIANTGNGEDSTNSGSAVIVSDNNTTQNNSANVVNNLGQSSVSGDNTASGNTGGNVTITTGDANVSGTMITSVNTNLAGVMVSEFNIADNQTGDYVLDFAANCIYGCGTGDSAVINSGNGQNSTNTGDLVQVVDNNTFQNNDANIDNTMTLNALSGANHGDGNTGGNTTINTGDANVSANSLTMANNNLQGNILYGVVNIYGDLVGDIIFPEELINSCCTGSATAANTGNGQNSTNTGSVTDITNNTTNQTNLASINNNVGLDANSGDNTTSANTDGNNAIVTGNTSVDAQVLNVANTNVDGGVWWLVLVNQAGQWIGKIMGAPDGANYAAAPGTEFIVNDAGEITVVNSGNGEGSTNTGSVTQVTNNTTTQTNNLNLNNTMNLSANSGGNSASGNTGGSSNITTGDANIIANLVNFVNNNVTGGGKMVVTVVNVFGSWLGDFVGPGQKKADKTAQQNPAIGGSEVSASDSSSSSNSSSSDPDSTGGDSSSSSSVEGLVSSAKGTVLAAIAQANNAAGGSNEVKVAAYSTTSGDSLAEALTAARKTVHINLAWILILVPAGAIFLVIRKLLLARAAN